MIKRVSDNFNYFVFFLCTKYLFSFSYFQPEFEYQKHSSSTSCILSRKVMYSARAPMDKDTIKLEIISNIRLPALSINASDTEIMKK